MQMLVRLYEWVIQLGKSHGAEDHVRVGTLEIGITTLEAIASIQPYSKLPLSL